MSILVTNHLVKHYGEYENKVNALNGVSIEIEKATFTAIVGTSGSGKSTLLNIIGGLDSPSSGDVIIKGKNISKLRKKDLTVFRRRNIGFIFQNYSLIPVLNVYDNIALPVTLDKGNYVDHSYIEMLMNTLGIWDKRLKFPSELSGGQQQRVAIARALANKPALILADEPTGNLDSKTTMEVVCLLKESSAKFHQTILMVTHNENIAQICDSIIHIEDGIVVNNGGEIL
ncbi:MULTISPECIES: ABC transporter ATP-binding protein [unclassified Clostridioides]|uniref:ABC transporter ATP-binding protein n=1 Tax=unclassified Clostridioides TaxID=2635829 RepID=UPI001D0C5265|nr:ABC transporter ATP-binding protein [Clostridioides sp. ES-S-0001-02]MCC0638610.1 ABC transporter ATP-binding protein [Clostridioides sp. ES-S-0049-03]MCC0655227.1 ABC transporter ATP-binding protein [Clostridioides sp. ES-S-0123-01]MCC0674998.1 ABC transporter ATP-binding protein [Clostridioides sp. ES-W-0018-02]MCC0679610.1 ABC transporter ATP-binding protein [Clostridioides sp. ES-S-0005-03]MCC0695250.1 ABC transporter ATP-binding protein [Clostridioides sp. ES-S-0048-02]MCC0702296.1 AB